MTANVNAMVRAAVDAYKTGDKNEARTLLERAIELDSYNETAWLWLSAVVDTKEEQQTCLENVLVINPENERARQGLQSLGIDPDAVVEAAYGDEEETGYAEEDPYAVPSSSSSVAHARGQADPEQYDDWVDGLGIGDSGSEVDYASMQDDLFGDEDFFGDDDDDSFDIDAGVFDDSSYDAGAAFTDDTLFENDYADTGDVYEDDYVDARDNAFDDGYNEDAFFDDANDDFLMDDPLSGDFDIGNTGTLYGEDDFEEDSVDLDPVSYGPSPDELFAQIPQEIQTTRAPGEKAPAPTMHFAIIGVLVLLNLGAAGFAVLQFMG